MKQGYTHISFVLDRSGSMSSIKTDTIGGFNTFLDAQKKAPGQASMTLVQFDNEYEALYSMSDIQSVPPLNDGTFVPRGSTALLDTIGRTINETGKRLSDMPENERPEKVLFVVLTDGEENSSREFANNKINDMITHQREAYRWEFIFLGANQDAIATATKIGISVSHAMTYNASAAGTGGAFQALAENAVSCRAGKDLSFTSEQRSRAMGSSEGE